MNEHADMPSAKKSGISRTGKWIAGISLLILFTTALFAVYLSRHWKPIASQKIKEAVLAATDSLYSINFDDININVLSGNISLKNIELKPDSAVYNRLKQNNTAPAHTYQVEVAGLVLHHANPFKVYFKKELFVNSIMVDNPRLKVFFDEDCVKADSLADKRTAYQRLSKILRSVNIEKITLRHVDYSYISRSERKPLISGIKGLLIRVTDLLIDSASQDDKSRFYYTKDIFAELKDYSYQTKDGMYTAAFGDLSLSTEARNISFKDVSVTPNLPEMEFSQKYPERHDRYDVHFNEIALQGIDFEALNTQRRVLAARLLFDGGDIKLHSNAALPRPDIDKAQNFPQLVLQRLKLNTCIANVGIKNSTLVYKEYNPNTALNGTVFFRQLDAEFQNVTNDSLLLTKNNRCKGQLSALLMGQGSLNMNLDFNLTSKAAAFNYSGTIGKMNLRALNPAAKAMALVNISSGTLNEASFSANGTTKGVNGILKMDYADFKIAILKKDTANVLRRQGMVSLLANMLLIKSDNPAPGEKLRVGRIAYLRPKWGSFFSMMWNGMFSALKPVVGLTEEMQQKLRSQSAEAYHKKQERERKQKEREQNQEERRKKREERKAKKEKRQALEKQKLVGKAVASAL